MEKLLLEKCCYCLKLKVGTLLIAVLGLLGEAMIFCLGIIAIVKGNFTDLSFFTVRNADQIYVFDKYLHAKLLVPCGVVLISVNSLLLFATIKGIPKYMLPWLILKGSLLVTSLYYQLVLMVAYPGILLGLAAIPLGAYLWTVVFSYYRQLKTADKVEFQQPTFSGQDKPLQQI